MNKARRSHSSCSLGEHVYVFFGYHESSIESLEVKAGSNWVLIIGHTPLEDRLDTAVAVLNNETIAIYGGQKIWSSQRDGIVLNVKTKTVRSILGGESDISFYNSCLVH